MGMQCTLAQRIVGNIEELMSAAHDLGDDAKYEQNLAFRERLYGLMNDKLDFMCAHILQHSDLFVQGPNTELKMADLTEDFKFGVWVNLAKNPRIKQIKFNNVNISTDLPKALALASIGIRVL